MPKDAKDAKDEGLSADHSCRPAPIRPAAKLRDYGFGNVRLWRYFGPKSRI